MYNNEFNSLIILSINICVSNNSDLPSYMTVRIQGRLLGFSLDSMCNYVYLINIIPSTWLVVAVAVFILLEPLTYRVKRG